MIASRYELSLFTKELLKASKNSVAVVISPLLFSIVTKLTAQFFKSSLLITALLFGGMTLYSFAFAAFLFTALPADTASALLHKAFPLFYAFLLGTAASGEFTSFLSESISVALMIFLSLTTVFARQILMPMINTATDAKQKQRFNFLHSASVLLTLIHHGVDGYDVVRLANV